MSDVTNIDFRNIDEARGQTKHTPTEGIWTAISTTVSGVSPEPNPAPMRMLESDQTADLIFLVPGRLQGFFQVADWLQDCVTELEETEQDAAAEGLEPPSQLAIERAEMLLRIPSAIPLPEPAVYAAEESAVAVMFKKGQAAVLVICEADGGFACFSSIDRQSERARYGAATQIPGAFVTEQLRKLSRV